MEVRKNFPAWRVSHEDIAGGIIETQDGNYEITRVIARPVRFRDVKADLRLMASAPTLLKVARSVEDLCSKLMNRLVVALDPESSDELRRLLKTLHTAIDQAEGEKR